MSDWLRLAKVRFLGDVVSSETNPVLDLDVERVAVLAQANALPVPELDLNSFGPSISGFGQYQIPSEPPLQAPIPTRAYSTDDPWNVARVTSGGPSNGGGSQSNGISSIAGTGLPRDWWKKQEIVNVNVLGQQGFILNRYLVYEICTDVSTPPGLNQRCLNVTLAGPSRPTALFRVCFPVGLLSEEISLQTPTIVTSKTNRR